jgi:hypothetical protein
MGVGRVVGRAGRNPKTFEDGNAVDFVVDRQTFSWELAELAENTKKNPGEVCVFARNAAATR